jgi:ATP-dependent DNA helicase 2 subunit 2
VLITDGEGPLDTDDKEDIIQKLEQENIQLTVLGVDFDDADFGFKEEDKSYIKVCLISYKNAPVS